MICRKHCSNKEFKKFYPKEYRMKKLVERVETKDAARKAAAESIELKLAKRYFRYR